MPVVTMMSVVTMVGTFGECYSSSDSNSNTRSCSDPDARLWPLLKGITMLLRWKRLSRLLRRIRIIRLLVLLTGIRLRLLRWVIFRRGWCTGTMHFIYCTAFWGGRRKQFFG